MANYAVCPFYESEKNGVLHCEGTDVRFPSVNDRGMWMKTHCYSKRYFKMCKFYCELMEKYNSDN